MTFDDGILIICETANIASVGEKPVIKLRPKGKYYFGYESIGLTRHYAAKKAGTVISELVHIWQDRNIKAEDICIIEGLQYKCEHVQHMLNEDELPITKITLERLGEDYVLSKNLRC